MYVPDKSVDGVELSASQYNRWIELATGDGRLEKGIVELGKNLYSTAAKDLGMAQALIAKEISETYSQAKDRLIMEDPDLADALREVKEARREYGKYKR
jgi:hypothetical protein